MAKNDGEYSTGAFASEVERLTMEELYDYHKYLSTAPVLIPGRDRKAQQGAGGMSIPDRGWKLLFNPACSIIVQSAVKDFKDYPEKSQNVKVELSERNSPERIVVCT